MALIFQIIYVNDRPTLIKLEQRYGPLKMNINDCDKQQFNDYDPILDDPELRELDRLMRCPPRVGGSD